MASTFRLNSHSYQGRYMYLSCTQTRDIATNTSKIDWTLTVTGGSSTYYTTGPTTVKINGETVYYKKKVYWDEYIFPAKKGSVSGSITVEHDNNGDASIEVSINTNIYNGVLITSKDTWTLDSNERFATISVAPNFNDEANPAIEYANPAGNLVTNLQACISLDGSSDSIAYRDIPGDGTKYTFSLSSAERDVLRSATTTANNRKVHFIVKSTVGGVTGYSSLERTLTIKNPKPIINPVITDINSETVTLTGNDKILVRYHSNASVTIGASAVKKATLTKQEVACGDKKLSSDGVINSIESNKFIFSATDSRKNTTTRTEEPTLVPYISPTCILEDSMPDAAGNMTVRATGNYFNGTFGARGNSLTVRYRCSPVDSGYGTDIAMTVTINGNTYTATAEVTGLDYQKAYVIKAYAEDALEVAESVEKRVKATPVFDWGENDFNFNVPVSMSGNKLTGLKDPENDSDGVSLGYARQAFAPIDDYCAKCVTVTTAGTNLDDYKEEGWYCFYSSAVKPTNVPAGSNGWLHVLSNTGPNGVTYTKQFWYRIGTPGTNDYEMYVRTTASTLDSWGGWTRYVTEKEAYQMVKLWENASPASTFAAQIISLDLSGYNMVEIVFVRGANGPNNTISWKMDKGFDGYPFHMSHLNESSNTTTLTRHTVVTDTGVEFGAGIYKFTSSTTNGTENTAMIPYKIYGVKGVS